jgi:DNA-binding LacI/PurR family transcriptional regulator
MATHLLEHGFRSIVHISGPLAHLSAADRREGFLRALWRAGLPVGDDDLLEGDYSEESGRAAARQLLQRSRLPQAIFSTCSPVWWPPSTTTTHTALMPRQCRQICCAR